MSDEKKVSDNEEIEGYFDTLIEEFDKNNADTEDDGLDMRDFSKFFESAKTAGSGFRSTVDSRKPRVDEDGMIVLFDEDSGVDATSADEEDIESLREEAMQKTAHRSEDNVREQGFEVPGAVDVTADETGGYDADSNMPADEGTSDEDVPKKSLAAGLFPQKGDSVFEIIRKIVFLSASAVFIGAGVVLASTLMQSHEAVEEQQELIEKVTTTVATTINEKGEVETIAPTTEEREQHNESLMNSFVEVSDDVKGFIELPGCDIYYPVVQGTDNNYYLDHTYDNKNNKAGAIFMDYRCVVSEDHMSPNIVLYGHNQEDGTMFGNLKKYKANVDFYKQNPVVSFNTGYGIGDYVIFAYFVTNVYPKQDLYGEVFHYHDYIDALEDEPTFNWYMEQVAERNQIIPPVDVAFGDQLLVLSTCSTEYVDSRFVVMARKLREDESKETIDVSAATLNPNAKGIDWDAVLYGRTATTTTETSETTETTTTTVPTTTTVTTTTTTPETTTTVTTTPETTTTTVTTTPPITTNEAHSVLGLVTPVGYTTTTAETEETTVSETETEETSTGLSLVTAITISPDDD